MTCFPERTGRWVLCHPVASPVAVESRRLLVMATSKVSKSAAVRAELPKHGGSPKLTAEALQKQGLDISAQYVSVVKNADKRRAEQKRSRSAANSRSVSSRKVELQTAQDLLGKAIELIQNSGGVKDAHQLIDSAAKLMERLT